MQFEHRAAFCFTIAKINDNDTNSRILASYSPQTTRRLGCYVRKSKCIDRHVRDMYIGVSTRLDRTFNNESSINGVVTSERLELIDYQTHLVKTLGISYRNSILP